MLLLQIISGVVQSFSETLEMHDFPFSQEAQWREHIGVIRQVDEIFIGAARFLLCCVGVSAKKKAGESKDPGVIGIPACRIADSYAIPYLDPRIRVINLNPNSIGTCCDIVECCRIAPDGYTVLVLLAAG